MSADSASIATTIEGPHTRHSYLQILKSTAIIGLSSVIVLALSVIRMKIVAMVLGPAGVGLMGLYSSVLELGVAISGMGVSQSGVRQVAEAGDADRRRLRQTAMAVHLASLMLGLVGAVAFIVLAIPISQLTFGTPDHAWGVAVLGAVVFLRVVASGLTALVQGLRRISALARINIYGALAGTIIGIPLIYWLGLDAVVPVLLVSAGAMLGSSWWYARDMLRSGVAGLGTEMRALLSLGLVFMVSGFLTMGAAYAIRIIVLHDAGVFAAGLYQGAWAVGGIYAGFVLQAMGADFYPRLTALANDDEAANRLVNEQAEISILLAAPGLIATITLAPLVLNIFYSAEFEAAVWLLRWICLGMMLRVIAWPMGFIVLAKAARRTFLLTEIAATIVHVGGAALLVPLIGADGAGIAFFVLYVWHGILIYFVVRRMSGFRWRPRCLALGAAALVAAAATLGGFVLLSFWQATAFGLALSFVTGLYALHAILETLPPEAMPARVRIALARFRRTA